MKKIALFLIFVLGVSAANAWVKPCDEAIVLLAMEHLTPEAKAVVSKHLGRKIGDDVQYLYALERAGKATHTKEIHYLHFDKKMKLKKMKKNDAYAETINALKVVAKHKSASSEEVTQALRVVINLMSDMHHISNVRIDNIDHSKSDFKFHYPRAEYGKKRKEKSSAMWHKIWHNYCNYPNGFSPRYRAYDMKICMRSRFDEFSKGSLKDWATESGKMAASYLEKFKPNAQVSLVDRLMIDEVNYDQMIKASCRLATLLNQTIK